MKRVLTCVLVLASLAIAASVLPQAAMAADASTDRVVVMYFHRTQRCPTCLKMGSYSEEAVKSAFAQEIKDGTVEFHYIDFQDQKNEAIAKGYKVGGPTLIVAKVGGTKVAKHKNLSEIWTKVGDRPAFIEYVQSAVREYQK
jgi:thiol-disulfide isomerase/thioredoxin